MAAQPIWVLGGRGMLGEAVCRKLRQNGHHPIATGQEVDIANTQALEDFAKKHALSHIINCAAYTQVDRAENDQTLAHRINAEGPKNLAAIASTHNIAIAHVSTDYVFDGSGQTPYLENADCAPLGVYGLTKREGEEAFVGTLKKTQAPYYVVRTSWLFGHGGPNFVQTMLRLFKQRDTLKVVGDQLGRPTFCDDLAEAIVGLLALGQSASQGPQASSGIYHFANTGQTSWHGFATAILEHAQSHDPTLTCRQIQAIATQDFPTPAKRPAYSVLATDKITQALKQAPRVWQTALADYLQAHWQKQQHGQKTTS